MESSLTTAGDDVPPNATETPTTERRQTTGMKHRRDEPQQREAAAAKVSGSESLAKKRGVEVAAKTHSNFVELRSTLVDAAAVAFFIERHHQTRLRDLRQVNTFFQAISNCTEELFIGLCKQHKHHVHITLERMYELYSNGKVAMSPAAHEFLIRCEQNGVRKPEWAAELESERTKSNSNNNNNSNGNDSGLAEDMDNAVAANTTTTTTTTTSLRQQKQNKGKDKHQQQPSHEEQQVVLLLSPRELLKKLALIDPRGRLERMIEMCSTFADLHTCGRKLRKARDPATAVGGELEYSVACQLISKIASKTRRICGALLSADAPHLSDDDTTALNDVMSILLDVTKSALATRPPSSSQQPISKLAHLAKWCSGYGLLDEIHIKVVADLEAQATRDLGSQAAQLETVMMLKAVPAGDEAAARKVLDGIWNEDQSHFEPYSADVLSSIAVIAGARGMSDEFRVEIARRLMKTYQKRLHASGVQLPRRALHFVNAEHSREKQASIKRMLAAEEESRRKKEQEG